MSFCTAASPIKAPSSLPAAELSRYDTKNLHFSRQIAKKGSFVTEKLGGFTAAKLLTVAATDKAWLCPPSPTHLNKSLWVTVARRPATALAEIPGPVGRQAITWSCNR